MLTIRDRFKKAVRRIRNRMKPAQHPAVPVFVLGEMRSGTNMLTEAFERSAGTDVYNENDEAAFQDFELKPTEAIGALIQQSQASHVVFKPIADSAFALDLLESFPGSKVIWIYRRWQDVVNSALRKWQDHREYLRLVIEEPERARWRRRSLGPEQLSVIGRLYTPDMDDASARALIWCLRNESFFLQGLHLRDDVLLVSYEDLVASPLPELRRAFDFVGLPINEQSFAHMNTGSVAREPEREVIEEIRNRCDALMAKLHAARAAD